MDVEERFKKFSDEYLNFAKIKNKRSNRPDLHAFIILDELFPGQHDMVCAAEHDEIWLDVGLEDLETLTDEQIRDLVRCGVRCDDSGAVMFA